MVLTKEKVNTIIFYLLCLVSFTLPFLGIEFKITSICIAILVIISFFKNSFFQNSKNKQIFYPLLSLMIVYIIHLIGLLYTSNFKYAKFDLEVKLATFLFPLVFMFISVEKDKFLFFFRMFTIACIVVCVICVGVAGYFFITQGVNRFFYEEFSLFMHPGYFAMYLNFALLIIFLGNNNLELFASKWLRMVVVGFILLNIILLSSKAGWICTLLILIAYFIKLVVVNKEYKFGVILLVGTVLLVVISYKFIPQVADRANNLISVVLGGEVKNEAIESTAVRSLIWKESLTIIKNNFIVGVGTGDVKDELISSYQKHGLSGAIEKSLNAHNTFLQIFISLGIVGFLALILAFICGFFIGLKYQSPVFIGFLLLVGVNFLTESMLETQAGVLFFSFFYCLIVRYLVPNHG